MTAVNFPTSDALVTYVNDNTILQNLIVSIVMVENRWYLFHY